MSLSSFHRAFKCVTGDSPFQHVKRIRLDKAKSLLVRGGMRFVRQETTCVCQECRLIHLCSLSAGTFGVVGIWGNRAFALTAAPVDRRIGAVAVGPDWD